MQGRGLLTLIVALVAMHVPTLAQNSANNSFEKHQYNSSEWSKKSFSDVVTIAGPAKLIFLAGSAALREEDGAVLFKDNFLEQCRYSYSSAKKHLAEHGATMSDIVRQTVYIVDVRNAQDYRKCRAEAFEGTTLPTSTSVYVSALAFPYMLFEVEITAAVAK